MKAGRRKGADTFINSALEAWEANEMETQLLHIHSWDFAYKGSRKKESRLGDLRAAVTEGALGAGPLRKERGS